jgi:hypothetical protein
MSCFIFFYILLALLGAEAGAVPLLLQFGNTSVKYTSVADPG